MKFKIQSLKDKSILKFQKTKLNNLIDKRTTWDEYAYKRPSKHTQFM